MLVTNQTAPTHGDFASRVGVEFQVERQPGERVPVTLAACSPLSREGGYASFTLEFRASSATPLGQGTWEFTADGLDPVFIFIAPVRATATTIDYEAVFNQSEPNTREG